MHHCDPPRLAPKSEHVDMWFCPDCGRGWEVRAGETSSEIPAERVWVPAGRETGQQRPFETPHVGWRRNSPTRIISILTRAIGRLWGPRP